MHKKSLRFTADAASLKAGREVTITTLFVYPTSYQNLALITKPCLNIIDALTGQWGREWGGEGRICNALIAGDHQFLLIPSACT